MDKIKREDEEREGARTDSGPVSDQSCAVSIHAPGGTIVFDWDLTHIPIRIPKVLTYLLPIKPQPPLPGQPGTLDQFGDHEQCDDHGECKRRRDRGLRVQTNCAGTGSNLP
jgi:hypothetical protein